MLIEVFEDALAADFRVLGRAPRKVDVRLPGQGNSNSHGARPVHLIISTIKWIRKVGCQKINLSLGAKGLGALTCTYRGF